MKNKLTFNDTVCEALSLALLQLMKYKSFHQITITEIVKVAGVSRSSFYRNFTSKEQMLFTYISTLYHDFFQMEEVLQQVNSLEEIQDFLIPRFRFIKQHQSIFTALCDHDMLYHFFQQADPNLITLLCGQKGSISPYHCAMYSGACAGIIHHWIENDFQDTEKEMASLFATPPQHPC